MCAEFRTRAEAIRTREQAETETRRALEVITFANAALYTFHPQADAVVGLEGEIPTVGPWIGVLAADVFYHSIRAAPIAWPIEIAPASIEHFERVGMFALSDLLTRPDNELTDLDNALLRAVHWFAASQAQVELENRLLNLTTCIEALVGPEDGIRIKAIVAERTALIVTRGEHRPGVQEFVRGLYGARSEVSHGEAKTVAEADVKELRRVAAELITTLLRRRDRVRTKEDLYAWLRRLSDVEEPVEPAAPPGAPKTLREWREERGWSQEELAGRVERDFVDADAVDRWERWRPPPAIGDLRVLANALGVRPEEVVLPQWQRWVVVREHRFHLTAHREEAGRWVARNRGWDWNDAVDWPLRAVDPEHSDVNSPSIIISWSAIGITSDRALTALAHRIVVALERALSVERLPTDPQDWQPPGLPEHWLRHLEARQRSPR